jgi:diphthine synthase
VASLTFVGLGLWDERDVSLRGLEAVREADRVFAEWYTAFLAGAGEGDLEALYEAEIEVLDRAAVEEGDRVVEAARDEDAAFLTAGDAMTATTHVDLRVAAEEADVETRVVPGASALTAVPGLVGLQTYKFGRATTLVFPREDYFPASPYETVADNLERGLHTLVLLDIENEEREGEPRCMTASLGAELLLRHEEEQGRGAVPPDQPVVGVARAGSPDPTVAAGPADAVADHEFGPPLHALVVPGDRHFKEDQALGGLAEWVGPPGEAPGD